MDINDEKEIEEVSQPPKNVRHQDAIVCIMEFEQEFPNIGIQIINPFLYCLPYEDGTGGINRVFNPLSERYMHERRYDDKKQLFRSYNWIRNDALKKNPAMKIIYEGIVAVDS